MDTYVRMVKSQVLAITVLCRVADLVGCDLKISLRLIFLSKDDCLM